MQDQIMQEVEETREEIARQFDDDVKKIAACLRGRAADRRGKKAEKQSREAFVPPLCITLRCT